MSPVSDGSRARYVAIITDGNGRWARSRGLPVLAGHEAGADTVKARLRDAVDLSPRGIREHLRLNRPIYVPTSAYGHFGREPDDEKGTFTWEKTDLVPTLRAAFHRH